MATLGEYSSLLQLGVGVGIGLSLFREPIEIRTHLLRRELDVQLKILAKSQTDFGKQKYLSMVQIQILFDDCVRNLENLQRPIMAALLINSLINVVF